MDQLQQKALNALEPYILLSKSANSLRAAADLVSQATSAPNTYIFAELLQTPNIQALQTASAEYASYFSLLQIFAWGTWSDYNSIPKLPKLSEAQSEKLRQLSLLTLSTTPSNLSYSRLQAALDIPTTRALEDLVISSIYAGLITAKLDTLSQRVDVSSVAPLRDLMPGSIPQMVSVLEDWDSRCVTVLAEIEGQVRDVRRKAQESRRREDANEKAIAKAIGENGDVKGNLGKRGGVDGDDEEMDVDENGVVRNRGAKRGGTKGFMGGLGKRLGGS